MGIYGLFTFFFFGCTAWHECGQDAQIQAYPNI